VSHKIEKPIRLRGGFAAEDPRLGRVPQFDDKSRDYDIRETLERRRAAGRIKGKNWYSPVKIDQGLNTLIARPGEVVRYDPSSCTGCSATLDAASSPSPLRYTKQLSDALGWTPTSLLPTRLDFDFAFRVYKLAQTMDYWAGENYEGSSVLGAAKALASLGLIGEYRWAFDHDDHLSALSNVGPIVVGTVWLNSMFDPRPSGLLEVDPTSGDAGGHAYLQTIIAVSRDHKRKLLGGKTYGEPIRSVPLLGIHNSWYNPFDQRSRPWGRNGYAYIWADDYFNHLWPGGEQRVTTLAFH